MADKNSSFEKVSQIISLQLSIDKDDVKLESSFDDLGMDSVDRVEIIMKLEEEFNIEIKDEDADAFSKVKDIVDYIEKQEKK